MKTPWCCGGNAGWKAARGWKNRQAIPASYVAGLRYAGSPYAFFTIGGTPGSIQSLINIKILSVTLSYGLTQRNKMVHCRHIT